MNNIKRLFEEIPKIQSNDFYLRELRLSDKDEVFQIYSDTETVKFQARKTIDNDKEANEYIQTLINRFENRLFMRWAIATKKDDQLIGFISLHHIDYVSNNLKIGYVLNKKYWNQNIMTQVLSSVIDYLFTDIFLKRIEAEIHPDNIASIKLTQKLGFDKEGLRVQSSYNPVSEMYEDRVIMALINRTK